MRRALAAWAVIGATFGWGTTAKAASRVYRRMTAVTIEGWLFEDAVRGAKERLAHPACQQVLSDFTDASGRTLRANLDSLGQTSESYLDSLFFYDATGSSHCASVDMLAFTSTGSRAVFVCVRQFASQRRSNPERTEAILIHEALHALGLGENPPTSDAIAAQVLARCR